MTVQETITTVEDQALESLKTAQGTALGAVRNLVDAVGPLLPDLGNGPLAGRIPAPASLVGHVYDFAGEVMDANRRFATELTEVLTKLAPSLDAAPAWEQRTKPAKAGAKTRQSTKSSSKKQGSGQASPAA